MADANLTSFDQRTRRISRRHQKMERGYVRYVDRDGLIVARPRRSGTRMPWKGLLLTIVLFVLFKAFLLANLGEITFSARVEQLAEGTVIEKIGAFLMQADPATMWVASQISYLGL